MKQTSGYRFSYVAGRARGQGLLGVRTTILAWVATLVCALWLPSASAAPVTLRYVGPPLTRYLRGDKQNVSKVTVEMTFGLPLPSYQDVWIKGNEPRTALGPISIKADTGASSYALHPAKDDIDIGEDFQLYLKTDAEGRPQRWSIKIRGITLASDVEDGTGTRCPSFSDVRGSYTVKPVLTSIQAHLLGDNYTEDRSFQVQGCGQGEWSVSGAAEPGSAPVPEPAGSDFGWLGDKPIGGHVLDKGARESLAALGRQLNVPILLAALVVEGPDISEPYERAQFAFGYLREVGKVERAGEIVYDCQQRLPALLASESAFRSERDKAGPEERAFHALLQEHAATLRHKLVLAAHGDEPALARVRQLVARIRSSRYLEAAADYALQYHRFVDPLRAEAAHGNSLGLARWNIEAAAAAFDVHSLSEAKVSVAAIIERRDAGKLPFEKRLAGEAYRRELEQERREREDKMWWNGVARRHHDECLRGLYHPGEGRTCEDLLP